MTSVMAADAGRMEWPTSVPVETPASSTRNAANPYQLPEERPPQQSAPTITNEDFAKSYTEMKQFLRDFVNDYPTHWNAYKSGMKSCLMSPISTTFAAEEQHALLWVVLGDFLRTVTDSFP